MKSANQQTKSVNQTVKSGGKVGKTKKDEWKYPVSKAFYEKMCAKGRKIFKELGYGEIWMSQILPTINEYLLNGTQITRYWLKDDFYTVFICLRQDMELAVARSAAARQRAAERRARKEAERLEAERLAVEKAEKQALADAEKRLEDNSEKSTEAEALCCADEVEKRTEAVAEKCVAETVAIADNTENEGVEISENRQSESSRCRVIQPNGSRRSKAKKRKSANANWQLTDLKDFYKRQRRSTCP